MNINDAFPSKYLKAGDLPEDTAQVVTIEKVQIEEIGREKQRKPVIHFEELDKAFVCNKTNAKSIARITGTEEFEEWTGTKVALYRAEVEFQGDIVESIRVKAPKDKPRDTSTTKNDDTDDIPF